MNLSAIRLLLFCLSLPACLAAQGPVKNPAGPSLSEADWKDLFRRSLQSVDAAFTPAALSPAWDNKLLARESQRQYLQKRQLTPAKLPVQALYLHLQQPSETRYQHLLLHGDADAAAEAAQAILLDRKGFPQVHAGILDIASFKAIWGKEALTKQGRRFVQKIVPSLDLIFVIDYPGLMQDSLEGKPLLGWLREKAGYRKTLVLVPAQGPGSAPESAAGALVDVYLEQAGPRKNLSAVQQKRIQDFQKLLAAPLLPLKKMTVPAGASLPAIPLMSRPLNAFQKDQPLRVFITGPNAGLSDRDSSGEHAFRQILEGQLPAGSAVQYSALPEAGMSSAWQQAQVSDWFSWQRQPGFAETLLVGKDTLHTVQRASMQALAASDPLFQKGFVPYTLSWNTRLGSNRAARLKCSIRGGGAWSCRVGTEVLSSAEGAAYTGESFILEPEADAGLPLEFRWTCQEPGDRFELRIEEYISLEPEQWLKQAEAADLIVFVGGNGPQGQLYPAYFPGVKETPAASPRLSWSENHIEALLQLSGLNKPLITFDIDTRPNDLGRILRACTRLYKIAPGPGLARSLSNIILGKELPQGFATCALPGESFLLPVLPQRDEEGEEVVNGGEPLEAPDLSTLFALGSNIYSADKSFSRISCKPDTILAGYKGSLTIQFSITDKGPAASSSLVRVSSGGQFIRYAQFPAGKKMQSLVLPYTSWHPHCKADKLSLNLQIPGAGGRNVMIPVKKAEAKKAP